MSPAQPAVDSPGVLPGAFKPHSFFCEPLLFVSYGLQAGLWTPTDLVARAKAHGFRQVAVEAEATPAAERAEFCMAARNALLVPGVWQSQVDYGSPVREAEGFDFYIAQVEGPGQFARVVDSEPPAVPHALVTNFGGIEGRADSGALIDLGYEHAICECWVKTDPNTTPAAQVDYALRVLGFLTAAPMAGLGENGAVLADYPDLDTYPGYAVFAAEELLNP